MTLALRCRLSHQEESISSVAQVRSRSQFETQLVEKGAPAEVCVVFENGPLRRISYLLGTGDDSQ